MVTNYRAQLQQQMCHVISLHTRSPPIARCLIWVISVSYNFPDLVPNGIPAANMIWTEQFWMENSSSVCHYISNQGHKSNTVFYRVKAPT